MSTVCVRTGKNLKLNHVEKKKMYANLPKKFLYTMVERGFRYARIIWAAVKSQLCQSGLNSA